MGDKTQPEVLIEKSDNKTVEVQEIYFNGIEIGMTLSDLNIILMTNGHRHSQLFMSFSTAKTLLKHLDQAMGELERRTEQTIMTMEDVKKAVDKAKNTPNK